MIRAQNISDEEICKSPNDAIGGSNISLKKTLRDDNTFPIKPQAFVRTCNSRAIMGIVHDVHCLEPVTYEAIGFKVSYRETIQRSDMYRWKASIYNRAVKLLKYKSLCPKKHLTEESYPNLGKLNYVVYGFFQQNWQKSVSN